MKIWITSENGIPFSESGDCTEALNELIARMDDGDELIFTKGRYMIGGTVLIRNRKRLTIRGTGSLIISKYDPCHPNDCKNVFVFEHCDDIVFSDFLFTTDNPTNIVGRIIGWNRDEGWFDVMLPEHAPVFGNEWIEGLDTMNEDYSFNFHIFWADFGKCHRYYKIDRNVIRFLVWPSLREHLDRLSVGELICMRYSLYAPGTFIFQGCNRVLMEDITIEACPGVSCVVHPRSSDFTFRRYCVRLARDSRQALACNTDGIHFTGATGKIVLEDCHFSYMGDDSLNLHCECGDVYSFDGKVLQSGCRSGKDTFDDPPRESLHPEFARPGDVLYIYDSKNTKKKAEMTVTDYSVNRFEVTDFKGELEQGDVVVNSALYPELVVKNCSVSRSRARGFLIKTSNVLIEDCHIEKIAGTGIIAACGVGEWHEMGPVHHMTIKNCVFDTCGIRYGGLRAGGIVIGGGPGSPRDFKEEEVGVFEDIQLIGNRFYHINDPAIFAVGVDGLTIEDNLLYDCASLLLPDAEEKFSYDCVAHHCANVVYRNNVSVNNEKEFLQEE